MLRDVALPGAFFIGNGSNLIKRNEERGIDSEKIYGVASCIGAVSRFVCGLQ